LAVDAGGAPSSFDRLRMRATVRGGSLENLILSLSKDEVFAPLPPRSSEP
jgi:hypothetical protein